MSFAVKEETARIKGKIVSSLDYNLESYWLNLKQINNASKL